MKKIKLTEAQLHKVIKESVKKILTEEIWDVAIPSEFNNYSDDNYDDDDDDDGKFEAHEKIRNSNMGVNKDDDIVKMVSQYCNIDIDEAYDNVVSYIRNEAEYDVENDLRKSDLYNDALDLGIESDDWIPYALEHMNNY